MKVYVVNDIHLYPHVDGHGYIIGVFSSEEKAIKAAEEARPDIEYDLGYDPDDPDEGQLYRIEIEEFEIDE